MVNVRFRQFGTKLAQEPVRAHADDSGFDLFACCPDEGVLIPVGEHRVVPCGVTVDMWLSEEYTNQWQPEAQVRSRSGLAAKCGVHVLNSPGTIDSGYRGELKVVLKNSGLDNFIVFDGDKIAQLVFCVIPTVSVFDVSPGSVISTGTRGDGGFGSTGHRKA